MTSIGHIGVAGGGAWGTALACLARRAGRRVTLWSRDPAISTAIARDRANPVYLPGLTLDAGIERLRLGRTDALDFRPRPRWPLDPSPHALSPASAPSQARRGGEKG